MVHSVADDIRATAAGSERPSLSVNGISQQVSHAAGAAGTRDAVVAIGTIRDAIGTLIAALSTIASAVAGQSVVTPGTSSSLQTAYGGMSVITSGMDAISEASTRLDHATRQAQAASRSTARSRLRPWHPCAAGIDR